MKKTLLLLFVCLFVVFAFASCTTLYTESIPDTYEINPGLQSGREYEILGDVSFNSTHQLILGLIPNKRGNYFTDFIDAAIEKYPQCDAIINCYIDNYQKYAVVFLTDTQVICGTAVKYK